MRVRLFYGLLLSTLACPAVGAQEELRRGPDKVLAPYVNATTFAAVAVDVQKLDLEAFFDLLLLVPAFDLGFVGGFGGWGSFGVLHVCRH